MREIKFRGLTVDTGIFIYGNVQFPKPPFDKYFMWEKHQQFEVLPETIGQFTGLEDKNGIEIYEGDTFHMGNPNISYTVIWRDCGLLGRQNRLASYVGLDYWKNDIVITGNIHQNPEKLPNK